MKRQICLGLTLFVTSYFGFGQDKKPFLWYNKSGQEASFKEVLKASEKAEIVLFGETHDNAIAHWLELELTKELTAKKSIILGAEMLEADNQSLVNEYLLGEITQKKLDSVARLWKNYKTDYKPLMDWAKENKIPFIATNVPRKYASLVYKNGFEALNALNAEEKKWIAPLPIAYDPKLPGYVNMLKEMEGHGGENLPKAQAIKDATMAHFILDNKKDNTVFLHFNGTYHSDNFEGIFWYLKKSEPNLKIVTIATVSQADILRFEKENLNKADFILVIDEDMTKTY